MYNLTKEQIDEIRYGGLTFREIIKIGCIRKGVTIAEMCDEVGLSRNAFNVNSRRVSPNAKNIKKISDFLGISFDVLILAPITKDKKGY